MTDSTEPKNEIKTNKEDLIVVPSRTYTPRKKIILSKKDLKQVQEMARLGLNAAHIASVLGMSKQTFFKILKRDEKARMAIDRGKTEGTLTATRVLMARIEAGSESALMFYLKFVSGFRMEDEFNQLEDDKNSTPKSFKFRNLPSKR